MSIIIFLLIIESFTLIYSQCTFTSILDVYSFSITDLSDGNFIVLYQERFSYDLNYQIYNDDGTSISNGTLYTFSTMGQSSISSTGLPDGRIVICYKENEATLPFFEFRDLNLNLLTGPFQASASQDEFCYRTTLIGASAFVFNFQYGEYLTFDYFINSTLRFSKKDWALTSSYPIVRGSKTEIFYSLIQGELYKGSVYLQTDSFKQYSYEIWNPNSYNIHISETNNRVYYFYVYQENSIWADSLFENYTKSKYEYEYDRELFRATVFSSAYRPDGSALICGKSDMSITCYFKNKEDNYFFTAGFDTPELLFNISMRNLPSGKFIFFGTSNFGTLHFTILSSSGDCNDESFTNEYFCAVSGEKCLNLAEMSFFLGCQDGYFSYNSTCLLSCPQGTIEDIPSSSCIGIPDGYYENKPLSIFLKCPYACFSCKIYQKMDFDGFEYFCPDKLFNFEIFDQAGGGLNSRARGQYIIPSFKDSQIFLKRYSTYAFESSITQISQEYSYNCRYLAYASLGSGISAILMDLYSFRIISIYDSEMNEVHSLRSSYGINSDFIAANNSFVFLENNRNYITIVSISVDENYECAISSATIQSSNPNYLIIKLSFEYISGNGGHLALIWTESNKANSNHQVVSAVTSMKGAQIGNYTIVKKFDDLLVISIEISELSSFGFVSVWTTKDQNSTFAIFKQEFDYFGNQISNSSKVDSNLTISISDIDVIQLLNGNYLIGFILCFDLPNNHCRISLRLYKPGVLDQLNSHLEDNFYPSKFSTIEMLSLPDGGFVVIWSAIDGYKFIQNENSQSTMILYGTRYNSNCDLIALKLPKRAVTSICSTEDCIFGFFIIPNTDSVGDCSGNNNLTFCDSLSLILSNLQGKSATIYFLKNSNFSHFVFTKELYADYPRNETADYFTLGTLTLKPLFCDDDIISIFPELNQNCSERSEKIEVYFKHPINIKATNLNIQNLRLIGSENIGWMNTDLSMSPSILDCLYTRIFCCKSSNPNVNCQSEKDLSIVPITDPTSPFFEVENSLNINFSSFESFVQPSIDSLFLMNSKSSEITILDSEFFNNKFRKGTFEVKFSSSFYVENIRFQNYNPWSLKNSSSVERNEPEGFFILAEEIASLNIINSTFSESIFQSPGCGGKNNFYLKNYKLFSSINPSNISARFQVIPKQASSLININLISEIILSNNTFKNIVGMVGSVLNIQQVSGIVKIDQNIFDSNFASRAFSNIFLNKTFNENDFPMIFENNIIKSSLTCLDGFGNIMFAGFNETSLNYNFFSENIIPLSNSIVLMDVDTLYLQSNTFKENGGLISSLWSSKIAKLFFFQKYEVSYNTINPIIEQSSCLLLNLENFFSSSNTFIDNFGPDGNSKFFANSITLFLCAENSFILTENDTFIYNITQIDSHQSIFLDENSNPHLSISYLANTIVSSSISIRNCIYDSSFISSNQPSDFQEHTTAFLRVQYIISFEDEDANYLEDMNKANISLAIENGTFKNLSCINCSSFLFQVENISYFTLKNCTFEALKGVSIIYSFQPEFSSEFVQVENCKFIDIQNNDSNLILVKASNFIMSDAYFENVASKGNHIISIVALNASFENIVSINSSCFFFSDSLTTILIRNFKSIIYLMRENCGLLEYSALSSILQNLTVFANYAINPIPLIDAISNLFLLSGSTFSYDSPKRLSFISIAASKILISQNVFSNIRDPRDIILFDISENDYLQFYQNIFYEPYQIFNAKVTNAILVFNRNILFTYLKYPILNFDYQYQYQINIGDNIFVSSDIKPSFTSESLISISDQKKTIQISQNIFLTMEASLSIIKVISSIEFYNIELQNNLFINNNGSQIYLSATNRITASSTTSESSALVANNIFLKNYARLTNFNKGYGGALQIIAKDQAQQSTHLEENIFILNKADLRGGAIYSDWNLPTFDSKNKYLSNFAQRENNIYTYPILVTKVNESMKYISDIIPSNVSSEIPAPETYNWSSIAPGIQIKETFKFILLDHFNQICYDDSSSVLSLNPEGMNSTMIQKFSSITSLKANEGLYTISSLKLNYPAGLNKTIFMSSNAISSTLNNYVKIFVEFRDCGVGEYINKDDQTCVECSAGYFLYFSGSNNPGPCKQCDQNSMVCLGGSAFGLMPGYWIQNPSSEIILQCPYSKACVGSAYPYNQGTLTMKTKCIRGHQGNLCSNCAPGYGKSSFYSECSNCSDDSLYYVKIGFGFLVSVMFFIYGIKNAINESFTSKKRFNKEMSIRVRIFLNYLQMLALLGNFRMNWSASFTNALSLLAEIGNVLQSTINIDCFLNTKNLKMSLQILKFIIIQLSVFIYIAFGLLFWILYYKLKKKAQKSETIKKVIFTIIIIIYNSLPQLIMSSLSIFKCMNLYRKDTPVYYWRLDFDVECYHDDHLVYGIGFNIPFLIIWTLVIPIWSFRKLEQNKNKLEERNFQQMYSFLYDGYKPEFFYWEFLQLGKKVLFIMNMTFVSLVSDFLQFYVAHALALLFLALHIWKQPFSNDKFNQMEKYSNLSCIFWGFLGLLISKNTDNVYSPLEIILIVLGIFGALSFLIFWLWKYATEYLRRRKIKKRRLSRKSLFKINKNNRVKLEEIEMQARDQIGSQSKETIQDDYMNQIGMSNPFYIEANEPYQNHVRMNETEIMRINDTEQYDSRDTDKNEISALDQDLHKM